VHEPRLLDEQPALADPRLAAQHQRPLAVGRGPPLLELRQLGVAADQRLAAERHDLLLQADPPRGRRRRLGRRRRHRRRRRVGMQQPAVRGDRVRRWARAELLAQQPAQLLEHEQPLGDVALSAQRLHQQHVAGLAVGL
jgi:hypothetical protein